MIRRKIKKLGFTYFITIFISVIFLFCGTIIYFKTYSDYVSTFDKESGIINNIVYVNDAKADYDYYMGLNYTTSYDGRLPSLINKNIYNDNNLIEVAISYSGVDIDNFYHGYVSLTERQDKYIYYKVLAVNDNGTDNMDDDYILLELIDNPFTDRPTNKGFNGWVTDYHNAILSYDYNTYTRYAKIPVTYTNNKPNKIEVDFYANWINAKVKYVSSSDINYDIDELNTKGMKLLKGEKTIYEDVSDYYIVDRIAYRERYPSGALNSSGRTLWGMCWNQNGCSFYIQSYSSTYVEGTTYYEYNSWSGMIEHDIVIIGHENIDELDIGTKVASLYQEIIIPNNNSYAGYYNFLGEYQKNGICNQINGCKYYELIQYYDNSGNVTLALEGVNYYYLVTRDTNILVLNDNSTASTISNQDKPLTLTSIYNGTSYVNNVSWNIGRNNVYIYGDTTIENIKIRSSVTKTTGTPTAGQENSNLYGNWNNIKLGRGIVSYVWGSEYTNFSSVIGGNSSSTGQRNNVTKYKLIIESGLYNTIGLTAGSSGRTIYTNAYGIYGNDYDRVNNDNNKLNVVYCASGSWGGTIYSSNDIEVALNTRIKSGQFGSNKSDYSTGIYVGGLNGGEHRAPRSIIVEGGYIYNLIGGPLTSRNRSNYNDTYMYVKGGSIDIIIGGAGKTKTYGNRIIQVTGGQINYSVFGGSNGIKADNNYNDTGTVDGDTLVYIGGIATIGDESLVNNNVIENVSQVESGSVFGIGNGRYGSSYIEVGSANNSNIIIDGDAIIRKNVYAGGNYGAVGINSDSSNTVSNININGGLIHGDVYGGGNNNGSGSTNVISTVNVNMNAGVVNGSLYGGSNQIGTIYGSTNVNVSGGVVRTSVYGGGRGGYQSSSNIGTYVSRNSNVTIGDTALGSTPVIYNNVYGGSAFGSVNGTTNNTNVSNYNTKVIVNKGIIDGSLFGGGEGNDTYTPLVMGNVDVIINGGEINNVFGGNDAAGTPNGYIKVYLNGGEVNNTYGGGNQTGVTTTNVYLQGGSSTNIYGGSNMSGNVPTTNILATSGKATTIYGGNNQGGETNESNIIIDGGEINTIYGGGKLAKTGTSNISLNASSIENVYGGGESASISNNTNITLNGSTVTNIYGGSNMSGNAPTTNILATSGKATTIYGGNNQGGETNESNININGSSVDTIYGGGNEANTMVTNVVINSALNKILNIYGGGNAASVDNSNILVYNGEIGNIYGGSNTSGNVLNSNIDILEENNMTILIDNIYGGNNHGGKTTNTDIYVDGSIIGNVYGGGNEAISGNSKVSLKNTTINSEVYGGGNQASLDNNTSVDIINSTIYGNVFGGGNAGMVNGNTDLYVSNSQVYSSIYAGGNGATAIVSGNTLVDIDGTTNVTQHVFGGGNAAATGINNGNSNSIVNIAGGYILGNVYGGANTSVINGNAHVNIGINAVTNNNLIKGDININGTVFGGGEANAGGSQIFDWSFISVTKGIDVLIDGSSHNEFLIGTSIFGSGNASSSAGISNVIIKNYGTIDNYKKNISIQRATCVIIDNSAIELEGIADRTNELFSDVPFTIARVDELKIKNGSTLFLQTNTNLLKAFTSLVDVTDSNGNVVEEVARVTINDETGEISSNVDNRLYIWESKNVNVLLDIAGTSYGKVTGMTFFGMFNHDREGNVELGMYSPNYQEGSEITSNTLSYFADGAYVMGLHSVNHDIKVDGFYTNYESEDNPNHINVNYIDPTALGDNCYKWVIGAPVLAYEIEDLKASKYSTLGTVELPLTDFSEPNTKFYIQGFAYNELDSEISLVDSKDIPRIASSSEIADTVMSLVMESSNVGWITKGSTTFKTNEQPVVGTMQYNSENSNIVPTLLFYLYHSKNLNSTKRLGKVRISLKVETPINEISSKFTDLNIVINLSRALINTIDYEGALTAGRKYELFATTNTNVTTKSSISTYFSLYTTSDTPFYKNGYHRTLISNYVLPAKTKITMIDYANSNLPEYYYYVVSEDDVIQATNEYNLYKEASYNFSKFIRMGSSSSGNHYDDETANNHYYDNELKVAEEEFIFIVDFDESNINENKNNLYLLMELRNSDSQVLIGVLEQQQKIMFYNLYYNSDGIINLDASLSNNNIYVGHNTNLTVTTNFVQQKINGLTVYDTSYFDNKLGIKLTLIDAYGNQVNGADLLGVTFKYDGMTYHPRLDGTVRFNLAEKVANVTSNIIIDTTNSNLSSGQYTLKIESFASPDGIYYGLIASDYTTISLNVVDTIYGLSVKTKDELLIIDKEKGYTLFNNNVIVFDFEYASGLKNPNIRVALYRRDYSSITTDMYNKVDLKNFFTDNYTVSANEMEYILANSPTSKFSKYMYLKPHLITGTYKIVFSLYDGDVYVGDVYKYLVIK